MKVSVIVPVYNTAPSLLECCIASIGSQEGVEVETVIVDDGSQPEVAESCEELLPLCGCSGIVVHQENQGLSEARNKGVDVATGEWIYFLDSDDYLANSTSIARLVDRAVKTGADTVVGRYHLPESFDVSPTTGPAWLLRCLDCGDVSFVAQDTLYAHARCVEERFERGLVHEDEDFSPRILFGSRLVAGAEGEPTYVRVPSEGSITSSTSEMACFKRCRGKLVVCGNTLSDIRFRSNAELWKLQQARAFGFANMAFKAWAKEVSARSFQDELRMLAESIDYGLSVPFPLNGRNIRTWACMQFVHFLGPVRYVSFLRFLFGKRFSSHNETVSSNRKSGE